MKRLGDGEVLDQRLPDVDLRIAKAIRKTVEMRWGKQFLTIMVEWNPFSSDMHPAVLTLTSRLTYGQAIRFLRVMQSDEQEFVSGLSDREAGQ